jgi:MoxR-like ATPase
MIVSGRALAFIRGRTYATPEDIKEVARDVMRHRLVLSYEALSDGVTSDEILQRVLDAIASPIVPRPAQA